MFVSKNNLTKINIGSRWGYKPAALALLLVAAFLVSNVTYVYADNNMSSQTAEDRLSQAVQSQGLILSDNDKRLTIEKCQTTQQKIATIQEDTDAAVRKRLEDYAVIQKQLLAIKLRMYRQAVDASELDLLIGKIQQGLDNLLIASNAYGATTNDLVAINCAEKPEMFRAGIVLMRGQRLKLLSASQNLYISTKNADKLALNKLKERLTL